MDARRYGKELLCRRNPWGGTVEFRLDDVTREKVYLAKPIEFEEWEPGTIAPITFELREDAAQALIDALWREGFRPTEGTGSAGALRAVERHLEDMRTLVFDPPGKVSEEDPS